MTKKIIFGGGCFWCTEAVFQKIKGVFSVTSGYAGGTDPNPNYDLVSAGQSGYVEVVQLQYDPAEVSLQVLLEIFFAVHDPTALNRQGADVGSQYASVIFFFDKEQKDVIDRYISQLEKDQSFSGKIQTKVLPFVNFFEAEDFHKNYFNLNQNQPYCRLVIYPKLEKLQHYFKQHLQN